MEITQKQRIALQAIKADIKHYTDILTLILKDTRKYPRKLKKAKRKRYAEQATGVYNVLMKRIQRVINNDEDLISQYINTVIN